MYQVYSLATPSMRHIIELKQKEILFKKNRPGLPGRFFTFLLQILAETLHCTHLLAQTTLSFLLFPLTLNARFFVKFALFHFTKKAFLLQFTLENFNRFFDVTVNDSDFQEQSPRFLYYSLRLPFSARAGFIPPRET